VSHARRSENRSDLGGLLRWAGVTVFCGAVLLGTARRSAAAAFIVTDPADPGGPNSLRSALAMVRDGDTINFNLPANARIALNNTQLTITRSISITGPGASSLAIDARGASRVFYIARNTGNVSISGLSVVNGKCAPGLNPLPGGQTMYGAGILTAASGSTLTLYSVAISGCSIVTASSGFGGGIATAGSCNVILKNCAVVQNTISATETGHLAAGGGVYCTGILTVQNTTISANSAYVNTTSLTPTYSAAKGGGLLAVSTTKIQGSTISGNLVTAMTANTAARTFAYGGGVAQRGVAAMAIQNSTISGNSVSATGGVARYGRGAGIYIKATSAPGILQNSTVAYNDATPGPAGGVYIKTGNTVSYATSSIIAKNTINKGASVYDGKGPLQVFSANNLIGAMSGFTGVTNGSNGNQIGTTSVPLDPLLRPLHDNGGPTPTHAIQAGSPAVDAGLNTLDIILGAGPLTTDQRGPGFPRLVNPAVDIGAFERENVLPIVALSSAPNVSPPPTQYTFTVFITDNEAVDTSTIGNSNMLVTGPNGFSQFAKLVSVTPATSAATVTATYMITATAATLFNGTYTIALLANQIADTSGNFAPAATLGSFIVAATGFASEPVADPPTAGIGQPVQFSAAGSLPGTAFGWDFGDGTTDMSGNANVSHAFPSAGAFTVTATMTSGTQVVAETVIVTVNETAFGTGPDSNGDGFSDAFATAFGLDPNDPTQSPVPSSTPVNSLTAARMNIKLDFTKQAGDSLSLSGKLQIPDGFNVNGAKIGLAAGDLVEVFTLNSKGKAMNGSNSASVSIKLSKGKVAAQPAKYSIKLSKANLAAGLVSSGLVNDNATSKAVTISVGVVLSQADPSVGIVEEDSVSLRYTAKKGESGSAK
jgi:hypothetical protein